MGGVRLRTRLEGVGAYVELAGALAGGGQGQLQLGDAKGAGRGVAVPRRVATLPG